MGIAEPLPPEGPNLEAELAVLVNRLRCLGDAPPPDPAFVARLEETLMNRASAAPRGTVSAGARRPSPRPAAASRVPLQRANAPRGWGVSAALGTVLVLALTVGVGLLAAHLAEQQGGGQPHGAASLATPAMPAVGRTVPPRDAPPAIAVNGTPVPPTTPSLLPLARKAGYLGFVTVKQPFPRGTPADPTAVAGIEHVVQQWIACTGVQDLDGAPRFVALFSDDYFRRIPHFSHPGLAWWYLYLPFGFSPQSRSPVITDARRLPDGRVGAIISNHPYPYVAVFMRVGDRWLIDELALYSPAGTPVRGQPLPIVTPSATHEVTIVMGDIFFRPEGVSIPANTPITINLVNQGGILLHSFVIDALHIRIVVVPGQRRQVTITAPLDTYEYYCDIPGHRAAGMIGRLVAKAAGTPAP